MFSFWKYKPEPTAMLTVVFEGFRDALQITRSEYLGCVDADDGSRFRHLLRNHGHDYLARKLDDEPLARWEADRDDDGELRIIAWFGVAVGVGDDRETFVSRAQLQQILDASDKAAAAAKILVERCGGVGLLKLLGSPTTVDVPGVGKLDITSLYGED